MRKLLLPVLALLLFCSHDMYLKPDGYFLPAGTFATIRLHNGTYAESENTIDRSRMTDVSLVGNGRRTAVPAGRWMEVGNATVLNFKTGAPGTWVAGVSTRSRDFTLTAEAFNRYLAHDGVTGELGLRKADGTLNDEARERYSKHVKSIFQVGEERSSDYATVLGYPIEFVPVNNPYDLAVGEEMSVRLLFRGEPLADEMVYVDHDNGSSAHDHQDGEHAHDESEDHTHTKGTPYRTDTAGLVRFTAEAPGIWHLRTIRMERMNEDSLTHESNWATLTFAVEQDLSTLATAHHHAAGGHTHADGTVHDHGDGAHAHGPEDHAHADEGVAGLPAPLWWGGSLLLVTGLFFYFNRKA